MAEPALSIRPVAGKADLKAFVALPYRLNAGDANWVAPLRQEEFDKLNPKKNAWYGHADGRFWIAMRGTRVVGRIAAHIDTLALTLPAEQGFGPGVGNWGMLDTEDRDTAHALIATAEGWLRGKGMTTALGPISQSIWDEPGLLVQGHDHPPTVMMGHHAPHYQEWIESAGYAPAKTLYTYELDITKQFPPIVERIIAAGRKNERIRLRNVDKSKFDAEAAIILGILNDAWADNWGFVPFTPEEIVDIGRKLKPIVFEDLIRIAEVDGEPVAFMITLPDLNEAIAPLNGSLFPFGWARMLWWLRNPRVHTVRVPLMGVVKRLQASRLASQLALMLIETIRVAAVEQYGAKRGEIGWILEDNQGMRSIADTIGCEINKVYEIYRKAL